MRKTNNILALAFMTIMTSCGCTNSDKKETVKYISLNPKTTQIKGDLGDYFEVVDKEYKIPVAESSFDQKISVEVKRNDKDFPFNTDKINPFGTNGGEEYHVGFGIELLGENGPVQVNNATDGGMGGPYSSEDVSSLFKLKKGETGYIRWTVNKTDGINSFQLTSALQKEDATTSNSSITNDETTDKTAQISIDSKNLDNVLNEYEKYVDDYVKFYKKAMAGDNSALTEYASLLEKAQALQTSLDQAQNDNSLSVNQASRMLKIQQKMLDAATAK